MAPIRVQPAVLLLASPAQTEVGDVMARTIVLGIDCTLAVTNQRPAGPGVLPPLDSFTELPAKDVRLSMTSGTVDRSSRFSGDWDQLVAARKRASIEASVLWWPDDITHDWIISAYSTGCPLTWLCLDGPIDGTGRCGEEGSVTGLMSDMIVTEFSRIERLEGGVLGDLSLQVAKGQIEPTWI